MAGMSHSYPVTSSVIPTSTHTHVRPPRPPQPGVAAILCCTCSVLYPFCVVSTWMAGAEGNSLLDCSLLASQECHQAPPTMGLRMGELRCHNNEYPLPLLGFWWTHTWAVGKMQTETCATWSLPSAGTLAHSVLQDGLFSVCGVRLTLRGGGVGWTPPPQPCVCKGGGGRRSGEDLCWRCTDSFEMTWKNLVLGNFQHE